MLKRFLLATVGLLAVVAAALPASAQAASGQRCQVNGTMLEDDIIAIQSDVWYGAPVNGSPGALEIISFTHPIELHGSLAGTGFAHETNWFVARTTDFVVHAVVRFASSTGYGPMTVTCPDGTTKTGGIVVNFIATGNFVGNFFNAHFEIIGSSGGLKGTTGEGTMSGVPGVPGGNGSYTGTVPGLTPTHVSHRPAEGSCPQRRTSKWAIQDSSLGPLMRAQA